MSVRVAVVVAAAVPRPHRACRRPQPPTPPPKQFRYEDMWQSHAEYDKFVAEAWRPNHTGQGLASIQNTLKLLQTDL